jgi:hypothetical protein
MISVSIFLPFSILDGFLFPFEHDSLPPFFAVAAPGDGSVGESCRNRVSTTSAAVQRVQQYNECSSTTNASSLSLTLANFWRSSWSFFNNSLALKSCTANTWALNSSIDSRWDCDLSSNSISWWWLFLYWRTNGIVFNSLIPMVCANFHWRYCSSAQTSSHNSLFNSVSGSIT